MKNIGVIGAGAMGSGIAQVASKAGHLVFIYDNNPEMLEKSKNDLKNQLEKGIEKGKISGEEAKTIIHNIKYVQELKQLSECNLVIEAIIENLEIKQKVFKELEMHLSSEAILASNTSSLSLTSIAAACAKPERVIGIHFFNPAHIMPLVEIIPAIQTEESLVPQIKQLIQDWGKVPVIAKDTPGFIVNRVARTFYSESIKIAEEGMADFATIDWALKTFGGFKMGPFELMDFIGNDVNYKVSESVWTQTFYEAKYKPSLTQKKLFEAQRFGRKSGKGYYNYVLENPFPEPKKDELLGKKILNRVLSMLINDAIEAVYLGIASTQDIETSMMKGVNYPKGLIAWGEEIGYAKILQTIDGLYNTYHDERYKASILLRNWVANGK
jgi:3-hydroxybutyryl-CoA dehydrogenase